MLDSCYHSYGSAAEFVAYAQREMRAGTKRDDVYHECSKFAVLTGNNRYDLWTAIVVGASD